MSENITNVKLLNVPLDNEYKHTLYFTDLTAQLAYFNNVSVAKTFSDFSYQRKDSKLRVNLSFDEALKYNYVMYQNTNYNDKWFFAFITDYEWKREDVTELTLETDVLQTWKFDITIKPSFIEREHVKNDAIGSNTIPENLEMGEYQIKNSTKINDLTDYYIIVACTEPPPTYFAENKDLAKIYAIPGNYNGIYSGLAYYRFGTDFTGVSVLNVFLNDYEDSSAVKCIFLYPKALIENEAEFILKSDEPVYINYEIEKDRAYTYNREADRYSYLDNSYLDNSYIPKNNKLLTYPYIYLLASNNNGGSAIYQYEHFKNTTMTFKIESALTPGGSIRLIPQYYKGKIDNQEEGLNLGKFPICNWTSDEYTNWLTQNSVNIGLNLATGLGQIIAGGVIAGGTGGLGAAIGGSTIIGGVSTITSQLAQIHQMSFTPAQANGNINCGDVITSSKENTFTFYSMTIKPEYMKCIDEYFSAYGYKTNRIKIPETNHRENWWFTKTIDINITGQIPIADMNKIKACYNNGLTFWRSASNMKNYSLSNEII